MISTDHNTQETNETAFGTAGNSAARSEAPPRIFFDASLTLYYGLNNPVGIVRAEHYVAEFLMRDPNVSLDFVTFDREQKSYRALTAVERKLIRTILFHRYKANPDQAHDDELAKPATTAVDLGMEQTPRSVDESKYTGPEKYDDVDEDAHGLIAPEVEAGKAGTAPLTGTPNTPPGTPRAAVRARIGLARRRFRSALTLPPAEFNSILVRDAARLMPVRPEYSPWHRLTTRITRRLMLLMARRSHAILYTAAKAASGTFRPDAMAGSPTSAGTITPVPVATRHQPGGPVAAPSFALAEHRAVNGMAFRDGDVLISMANTWDYMDYGYLHHICAKEGVRFVAVLYDVIAMMHPFTTPGPPHIYQRHWVEIGHDASHIVAISQHSLNTYTRYVCQPNDLTPPLSYAYLPNFLKTRSSEIGEKPVDSLSNHPFVFFCSTIETRKNHQVLLHAWDRLRDELGADALPTLVFVGKWGWGTETVRMLVERNWRLRKRVRVLDSISDAELIWMYKNARFTVFPALSEGFGLAVAESLSFGTPVVVSDCPALQEAAENLMPSIDPFDLPSWVNELRSLIVDDRRLEVLREAAAQYRGPDYDQFGAAMRDAALSAAKRPHQENV
ncbi:glycosyltransferase [Caballeronia sp. LjRoot31]|uniref:glycosyltransferase n=1 Tax=Caballeronia sp. LjRoot31 TaxID=3342324 RepID=UPI003ECD2A21